MLLKQTPADGIIYKEHRFILKAGQSQTEGLNFMRVFMLPYNMAKASHVKRTSKQEAKEARTFLLSAVWDN